MGAAVDSEAMKRDALRVLKRNGRDGYARDTQAIGWRMRRDAMGKVALEGGEHGGDDDGIGIKRQGTEKERM